MTEPYFECRDAATTRVECEDHAYLACGSHGWEVVKAHGNAGHPVTMHEVEHGHCGDSVASAQVSPSQGVPA